MATIATFRRSRTSSSFLSIPWAAPWEIAAHRYPAAAQRSLRYNRRGFCYAARMLNPTDPEHLVDSDGRPYFLWDCELTLDEFRRRLRPSDASQRAYFLAKLMRQAKPDDVFQFVSPREIHESWPQLRRHLGRSREFWAWLLESWKRRGVV